MNSAGKASLLMNVLLLVQLLFAGFFKELSGVTPALRWIQWVSAFHYAFESLVVSEISGLPFSFTVGFLSPHAAIEYPCWKREHCSSRVPLRLKHRWCEGKVLSGSTPAVVLLLQAAPGISTDMSGDTFLKAVNLGVGSLTRDVALLAGLYAAFLLLGILLLHLTVPRRLRMSVSAT